MSMQALKVLRNRIVNMLGKAVIELIAQNENKGKLFVQVSGLSGDTSTDYEHLCQYGFRSMPMKGARGIWVAYGGDTDNMSIIVADDKNFGQYELEEGDVMIYNQNGTRTLYKGDTVISTIEAGGTWQVDLGNNQIKLTDTQFLITIAGATYDFGSALVAFNKPLDVTGAITSTTTITATTDVIGGGKSLATHTHGGVQSGGSTTSPPI